MPDATAKYYNGRPGTTVAQVGVPVPTGAQWNVKMLHFANNTASQATITVHLVPSGGTASADNIICAALPITGNNVGQMTGLWPMAAGDFLAASQGTAGAITAYISGVTTT